MFREIGALDLSLKIYSPALETCRLRSTHLTHIGVSAQNSYVAGRTPYTSECDLIWI